MMMIRDIEETFLGYSHQEHIRLCPSTFTMENEMGSAAGTSNKHQYTTKMVDKWLLRMVNQIADTYNKQISYHMLASSH